MADEIGPNGVRKKILKNPISDHGGELSKHARQEFLQQQLDKAAGYFGFPTVRIEVLTEAPLTILVSQPGKNSADALDHCLSFVAGKALGRTEDDPNLLFRCVELSRLGQIIQTGCDVFPSHSPLYAACSGKALEYGGSNKVVQVFDPDKLQKTFMRVRKSEAPYLLERLNQAYPSSKEIDDEWLWFSKLPPGDFRIGTGYEMEYSFYIPGNPIEALLMIFLVGGETNDLRAEFIKSTSSQFRDEDLQHGCGNWKNS